MSLEEGQRFVVEELRFLADLVEFLNQKETPSGLSLDINVQIDFEAKPVFSIQSEDGENYYLDVL